MGEILESIQNYKNHVKFVKSCNKLEILGNFTVQFLW